MPAYASIPRNSLRGEDAAKGWKSRLPECFALALYMGLLAFLLMRHEPWFDEAQAWLMARDLSIGDLVFGWLRYEGHPPLWYLLLALPAKLGVPYEWGLKSVEWICAVAAAGVLIFKAPFPRSVRLLLPFTYYLFFQYGAISRSYCLMMLFLWLAAAFYARRNERPGRLIAALALLGGTSAYGMLIGFGVALSWFVDMVMKWRREGAGLKQAFSDTRFRSLLALAAVYALYAVMLYPASDQYNLHSVANTTLITSLNAVLAAPAEALFLDVPQLAGAGPLPWYATLGSAAVLASFFAVMAARRCVRIALLALAPLFAFFATAYYTVLHSGILAITFLFLLWITARRGAMEGRALCSVSGARRYFTKFRPVLVAAIAMVLAVQLYWTAMASVSDVRGSYDSGAGVAAFIRENKLEDARLFLFYKSYAAGGKVSHTYNISSLPYFEGNIYYNLNGGNPGMSFAQHRFTDAALERQAVQNSPPPDFIVCPSADIPLLIHTLPIETYVRVATYGYSYFWKAGSLGDGDYCVYMREDLQGKYPQLNPLEDPLLEQYKKLVGASGVS